MMNTKTKQKWGGFYINSEAGRIGSFWWVNADTRKSEMISATYNSSRHFVWRQGTSGFGTPGSFLWKIINQSQ